ncbi:MFS general substrate transporter [Atractiella rhizophila]|nr:MFS general substrate transporter [Atractiella rhizophila]
MESMIANPEIALAERRSIHCPMQSNQQADICIRDERQHALPLESNASSLPPVDVGFRAWAFVSSAFMLQLLVRSWGSSFGTVQAYLTTSPLFSSASAASISSIGTTGVCLQYCCLPFIMAWYKRNPRRIQTTMKIALVISAASLFVSSFSNSVWQLMLTQGLLWGVSSSILQSPVLLYLSEWFSTRRGLAGGIIFGASGVGGAIVPPFLGFLLGTVKFAWAVRIWAGLYFVLGTLSLWHTKPRIPPSSRSPTEERDNEIGRSNNPDWSRKGALKAFKEGAEIWGNPLFLLIAITVSLQSIATFPVSFHLPTYASTLGYPFVTSTLVLSAYNIAATTSYILIGYLTDKIDFRTLLIFTSVFASIFSYIVWGFAQDLALTFVFASGFGVLIGGVGAIWPAAGTQIVRSVSEGGGIAHFDSNSIFSLLSTIKGIAALAGPPLASLLYQPTTQERMYGAYGFQNITIFVGSLLLGAGIVSAGTRLLKH